MTDPLYLACMIKKNILKKEGIIEKISCDRRSYESVDDRSDSGYISKINGKQNSGTNGSITHLVPNKKLYRFIWTL